ncbi:uncharacterized protein LOC134243730 [Saccostrea cucullata]|uniref:uncharacterized protein LOC134243730 n=1 Tax=Saccostrea cuccullata TaxID=36930 RepID=UPI002ED4EB90
MPRAKAGAKRRSTEVSNSTTGTRAKTRKAQEVDSEAKEDVLVKKITQAVLEAIDERNKATDTQGGGASDSDDREIQRSVRGYGGQTHQHTNPSFATLQSTACSLIDAALAPNTKKLYRQALNCFSSFIQSYYKTDCIKEISLGQVICFVSYLFSLGKAPSSISTYLAALAYYFKMTNAPDLSNHFLIKKMLSGAKRLVNSSDVRQPITLDILGKLLVAIPHVANSKYQEYLYMAMFLLAFYAFLRVGEITVRSGSNPNLLLRRNVSFKRDKKQVRMVVTMINFKHNLGKKPVQLEINPQPKCSFCPVQAMRNYLEVRGAEEGALFCYRSGRPISRTEFCDVLRSALKFSKLDSNTFKAHSFRIGAATQAHLQGFSDSQIRVMGRWHSESFKRYIRVSMFPTF